MKHKSRTDGLVYSTGAVLPDKTEDDNPQDRGSKETCRAVVRIERKGRSGKTVTVVEMRGIDSLRVKELAGQLKNHCGSGGTVKGNVRSG